MRKKWSIILLLTSILSIGLSSTAPAAQTPSDIAGHWAESKIKLAITMGLFNDEPHLLEQFEPDRPMMRVELIGVLNRLFAFSEEADVAFADVDAASPYAPELRRAAKAGYFSGDDQQRAHPERLLTRADAAAMLYRIENYPKAAGESKKFKDYNEIPPWAVEAVDACVKKGVMKGDAGLFRPNDQLTRAEIVALVYNLMNQ